MKKLFFIISLFFYVTDGVHAQLGGHATPNTSTRGGSAGTGSLINVDLYTGTGSVNIPIYSYAVDNLDLSISLSYDAKGMKVDDLASSVGLGWNLNFGGFIVRQARGIEDEVTTPAKFVSPSPLYTDWGNSHDTLQGLLVPGAVDPLNPPVDTFHFPVYDDEESDIFYAKIGGRSIQFSLKNTGSGTVAVAYPESKVKIEVLIQTFSGGFYWTTGNAITGNMGLDSVNGILNFKITDEYGNQFFFERGDYRKQTLDLPPPVFANPNATYYATENWILTKILTYSGKQILYTYARKYVDYEESQPEVLHSYPHWSSPYYGLYPLRASPIHYKGVKNHISKIQYPDSTVVSFDLDSNSAVGRCDCKGNFRVKQISVAAEAGSQYKRSLTYALDQAYFNTPKFGLNNTELPITNSCASIENALDTSVLAGYPQHMIDSARRAHTSRGLRLKLKRIRQIGTDNTTSRDLYTFTYNQTPLPYRFSPQKDIYGYYNGGFWAPYYHTTGDSFALSIPYNGSWGWGADRSFSFTNAQACILTKVTNGLNGEDSIVYADYQLENPVCGYGDVSVYNLGCSINPYMVFYDQVNDGVVVGKIISRNGYSSESTVTTEYSYRGGQRFYQGGYMAYIEPSTKQYTYTNYFTDYHDYVNGSNHGFDTVVVSRYGYNNIRLSKTKHVFSNLIYTQGGKTYSCMEKPTGYYFFLSSSNIKKYRMGLPLVREEYDELDSLVARDETVYEERIVADSVMNLNRINDTSNYNPGWGPSVDCYVCATQYWFNRLFDYRKMFISQINSRSYLYDPVTHTKDSLVIIKNYRYNPYHRLARVSWTDSKGDNYAKIYKYNTDYGSASSATAYMNTQGWLHLLNEETWLYNSSSSPTDSSLVDLSLRVPQINTYLHYPASYKLLLKDTPLNTALIYPSSGTSSYVNVTAALNLTSGAGTNLINSSHVTAYDARGNVTEEKFNDISVYKAHLYDVNSREIATVVNCRTTDYAHTSFENGSTNLALDPTKIIYCDTSIVCPQGVTGKYAYKLIQSNDTAVGILTGPLKAMEYIISFWSTDNVGSNVKVNIGLGATTVNLPTTVINTVGNWKLHVAKFTPVLNQKLRIQNMTSGSNSVPVYIDEVRLYPVGAFMTTYTYRPLFGVSSLCDQNNYITTYEYDVFGRQTIVRDMQGNVVSKTETQTSSTDPSTLNTNTTTPTY